MKFVAVLAIVALAACATPSVDHREAVLSPSQLNDNAAAYDGRNVRIRGYVLLGTNGRSLYESREQFGEWVRALERSADDFDPRDYDKFCVTMLNADTVLEHQDLLRHQTITVRGRFMRGYMDGGRIDLQACGDNAIVLDDADVNRVLRELQRTR